MTFNQVKTRLRKQLGAIGPSDQYHYELLLDSWNTYLQAGEELKKGLTIESGSRLFVHPAVNVRNEAHKQILKLSKLFGIVPISRGDDTDTDDEMSELIGDD